MTGNENKGLQITGMIVPAHPLDEYATHDSKYGKGGWREVATIAERDAIPMERRSHGMVVYVQSEFTAYILNNGTLNGCWLPLYPRVPQDVINRLIAADKIVLPELEPYAKKIWVEEQLQNYISQDDASDTFGAMEDSLKEWVRAQNYLTEHQSLLDYYTRSEINDLLDVFMPATQIQELFDLYLPTNDIIETYLSKAAAEETYVKKVDYIADKTAHDELYLALKDAVDGILANYVTSDDVSEHGYLNQEQVAQLVEGYKYMTADDLEEYGYITAGDLNGINEAIININTRLEDVLTRHDFKGFATEAYVMDAINALEIPSLRGYATEAYVVDKINALLGIVIDSDELAGFATEAWVRQQIAAIPVPEMTGYAREAWVADKIAALNIPSLQGYATEAWVADKIAEAVEHVTPSYPVSFTDMEVLEDNDGNLIVGYHEPDLSAYATKTWVTDLFNTIHIPSLQGYATEAYVADRINALTIPSLQGYATEAFVTEAINNIKPTDLRGFATEAYVMDAINALNIPDIRGMATEAWVLDKIAAIRIPDITTLASKEWVGEQGFLKQNALQGLATEALVRDLISNIHIPSLAGYATEAYVQDRIAEITGGEQDLTGFATKEWVNDQGFIKSLRGYATEAYVNDKISGISVPSLQGYATEAWVLDILEDYTPGEGGGESGTTNYNVLRNKPSINGVTLSGELSSAELGLASKSEYDEVVTDLEEANETIETLQTELNTANETIVALREALEALTTRVQALEDGGYTPPEPPTPEEDPYVEEYDESTGNLVVGNTTVISDTDGALVLSTNSEFVGPDSDSQDIHYNDGNVSFDADINYNEDTGHLIISSDMDINPGS